MTALLLSLVLLAAAPDKPTSRRADLEALVADLAEQVAELRKEVRELRRQVALKEGEHSDAPPLFPEAPDAVREAVARGDFVVGMTEPQARAVIGKLGWAFEVDREQVRRGNRTVEMQKWHLGEKRRLNGQPYFLVFEDGVIVQVKR